MNDKKSEDEKILKIAQEVGAGEGEIDESTADNLAHQIFDQLFDEELKKLLQS
jgi:hypothetical protein